MDYTKINWQPLFDHIRTTLNTPDLALHVESGHKRPKLISGDLLPYVGIFGPILSECELDFFNFGITVDGFWATVYLNYQHKDGGSNGMKIFTCFYNSEKNNWAFSGLKEY